MCSYDFESESTGRLDLGGGFKPNRVSVAGAILELDDGSTRCVTVNIGPHVNEASFVVE